MYAVGRVEALRGAQTSYGTAFQFNIIPPMAPPNAVIPFFITNKHVVQNCSRLRFLIHRESAGKPSGNPIYLDCPADETWHYEHPSADLVAICVGGAMQHWREEHFGQNLFWAGFAKDAIVPESELSKLDIPSSVLLVGCPSGLWDELNGFPLFRRGSTASHPAVDYEGKSEFMIDAAVFSGSSGSPVWLYDVGLLAADKTKPNEFAPLNRQGLLGILYAGPRIDERGKVIKLPVPTSIGDEVSVATRMHLGNVIKGRELRFMAEELEKIISENSPQMQTN